MMSANNANASGEKERANEKTGVAAKSGSKQANDRKTLKHFI